MENKYNLDRLIETFERHAVEFDQKENELLNKWTSSERSKPTDVFNISKALLEICKEIKELKDKGQ